MCINQQDLAVLNSLGYAFEQCYTSCVAINESLHTDEAHLRTLQSIAAAYDGNPLLAEHGDIRLLWPIDKQLLHRVLAAKTLQECYC